MDGYVTIGTKLDTDGLDQGLSKLESGLKSTSNKMDKYGKDSGNKFSAGFLIGFSVLTSVITSFLGRLVQSLDSAISRVDTLNNFSRVMENLGQSAEDSQQAIDYMSEKLTGLPTTLDAGASAVQRFTSANNNVKASTEMFLALNNAIIAGGAPMQQQQSALEQLTQAYSRGVPEMEEWRAMMVAAPAQMKQVAQAMGYIDANALYDAIKQGTVSMNDFMITLVDLNNNARNGFPTLEEQARTSSGGIATSITNLKTAFTKAMAEILQTIGQTNIANFFQSIIDAIKAVVPYLAAFAKSFITVVSIVAKAISTITNAINKLFGKGGKSEAKEFSADLSSASVSMGGLSDGASGASSGLGKAAKSAKELKKQLSGFDEMNVLQDNTSASGGGAGGGGGIAGGLGDLGSIGDIGDFGLENVKDKITELIPLTELFTASIWGLGSAFGAIKILELLKQLGLFSGSMGDILRIGAGIGLMAGGIYLIIEGVINYLKDPTWENFLIILGGIAVLCAGIALAIGPIPALIAAIVLVIAAIGLAVYKNWDKIKAVLDVVGQWIYDHIIEPVVNYFTDLWEKIKSIFAPTIEFLKPIIETIVDTVKTNIENIIRFVKTVYDNVKIVIDNIKQIIGIIKSYINDHVIKPVSDIINNELNGTKQKISGFIEDVKKKFEPFIKFFRDIMNKVKNIFVSIGSTVGNALAGAFKTVINTILALAEGFLNKPINAVNKLIEKINTLPGVQLTTLKTFQFARLAKGGIINQPGRGVAIGGEAGREGVIPLTDSQQMELLGEAIGKYITVNASITNTMNGRIISRELQKINNENDFAFNR